MTLPTDPDPYLLNGIAQCNPVSDHWMYRNFKIKSWLKKHGKEHNYKFKTKQDMSEITIRVVICGSRDYNDYDFFWKHTSWLTGRIYEGMIEIVSGGASGADAMAKRFANETFLPYKEFPADCNKNGKSDVPIRNREMAKYGTHLIAFWDGKSKGTKNMIDEFTKIKGDENVLIHQI